ncbi:MAG TPA: PA2779 family protein [Acidobacteriaceae bacterium]|jgi:pyruvate/2-oxoglutarate dehydrogenase complex dihydrolipoamide acyltransferase (E2) component|nr:PA2779 family protein [Acidobacteriaceae bacterium]
MQISRSFRFLMRSLIGAAIFSVLLRSPALRAEEPAQNTSPSTHLVSPAQLQQQVQSATEARQKNIQNLTHFLSTPRAEQAMKQAKVDPSQVREAIPTLSDQELSDLSSRASQAQADFAVGGMGKTALIIVIIAIVVVEVILFMPK